MRTRASFYYSSIIISWIHLITLLQKQALHPAHETRHNLHSHLFTPHRPYTCKSHCMASNDHNMLDLTGEDQTLSIVTGSDKTNDQAVVESNLDLPLIYAQQRQIDPPVHTAKLYPFCTISIKRSVKESIRARSKDITSPRNR